MVFTSDLSFPSVNSDTLSQKLLLVYIATGSH